jgi:hypothetical protein
MNLQPISTRQPKNLIGEQLSKSKPSITHQPRRGTD